MFMTMMITSTIAHRAHRIVVDITEDGAREPQVLGTKKDTAGFLFGTKEEPLKQRAARSYKRPV